MKKLACLMIALCLVAGILLVAVADVNHGHGPGYHDDGYGAADGHDVPADDGHGVPTENSH